LLLTLPKLPKSSLSCFRSFMFLLTTHNLLWKYLRMNGNLHEIKLVQKQQLNPQLECSVYYVNSLFLTTSMKYHDFFKTSSSDFCKIFSICPNLLFFSETTELKRSISENWKFLSNFVYCCVIWCTLLK
jgi:hypothetical protein